MNNPVITVLMSAYNAEKYLREAIESILNQTFKDFEFIIINDCSTDKTKKIIEEYANKDARIKLINNATNLGLTKSLNIGLEEARGEYVARLDADDVSLSERLEKQLEFMNKNRDITLTGAWAEIIDEEGKAKGFIKGETDETALYFKMIFSNQLVHSSILFNKDSIVAAGGYNEKYVYAQDYELYSRLLTNNRIANQSEVLIKLRTHNGSITRNEKIKAFYQQAVLEIIKNNMSKWTNINSKTFDELAQTVIVKNSPIELTWGKYRRCKTTLKKITIAFLNGKKVPKISRQKIKEYYKKINKRMLKKLLKSYLPTFILK